MTPADFYAFEQNTDIAFAALLNGGGYPVQPFFVPKDALAAVPDNACFVSTDFTELDQDVLAFRDVEDVGRVSEPAGWTLIVEITHRVPVTDDPSQNKTGGPYPRLLRQRGEIRALVLHSREKLNELLHCYDILSLMLTAPRQGVNREKFAHEATEAFRLKITARTSIPS